VLFVKTQLFCLFRSRWKWSKKNSKCWNSKKKFQRTSPWSFGEFIHWASKLSSL